MLMALNPCATQRVMVSHAPLRDVGSMEATPMKRGAWSLTIACTSSLETLPSAPARRPTTTPRSTPAASISASSRPMSWRCAAGEGSKPTVRVKPSRRSPAAYISVSRKPRSGGRRRKSMTMGDPKRAVGDGSPGAHITSWRRSCDSP